MCDVDCEWRLSEVSNDSNEKPRFALMPNYSETYLKRLQLRQRMHAWVSRSLLQIYGPIVKPKEKK